MFVGIDNPKNNMETTWWNLGLFLINNPNTVYSATERTVTFEGLDLMAKLTGRRSGQLPSAATQINQGESIAQTVKTIISDFAGFNRYIINDVGYTVPYDIKKDMGSTIYDLLVELRDLYPNWEMFFDVDGVFHWQPIPSGKEDAIILDLDELKQNIVISESIDVDFENVKNNVIVYGRLENNNQVKAIAQDTVENSPFNVDKIGEITYIVSDSNIPNNNFANLRAHYELYLHSRMNDSINLNIVPIYWLNDVNAKIKRTNEDMGLEGEYLIKSLTIPLDISSPMTINAMKIYEDWEPEPEIEDIIETNMFITDTTSNSITVTMTTTSSSNITKVKLTEGVNVIYEEMLRTPSMNYSKSITIENLNPNTSYKLSFEAENINGNTSKIDVFATTKEKQKEGEVDVSITIESIESDRFRFGLNVTSTYSLSEIIITVPEIHYYQVDNLRDSYVIAGLSSNTRYTLNITARDIYGNEGNATASVTTSSKDEMDSALRYLARYTNGNVYYSYSITSNQPTIKNALLTMKNLDTSEISIIDDYSPTSVSEKTKLSRTRSTSSSSGIVWQLGTNLEFSFVATSDSEKKKTLTLNMPATPTNQQFVNILSAYYNEEQKRIECKGIADFSTCQNGFEFLYIYIDDEYKSHLQISPVLQWTDVYYADFSFYTSIELEKGRTYKLTVEAIKSSSSSYKSAFGTAYLTT